MFKNQLIPARPYWGALLTCLFAVVNPAAAPALEKLSPEDAAGWRGIRSAALTPDGEYLVYTDALNSGVGKSIVVVQSTRGTGERKFDVGDGVVLGRPQISPDGRWLAFQSASDVTLLKFSTGEVQKFPGVVRFEFNGVRGDWIALRSDKEVRVLRLGSQDFIALGATAEIAINKQGSRLACVCDGALTIADIDRRSTVQVDASAGATYSAMAWSPDGSALAVLRTTAGAAGATLVVFSDLHAKKPSRMEFAPGKVRGFPQDFAISTTPVLPPHESRPALTWHDNGQGVFIGIRPNVEQLDTSAQPSAVLRIWHWQDGRTPFHRRWDSNSDRSYSYLGYVSLKDRQFIRLADDSVSEVMLNTSNDRLIAYDNTLEQRRVRDLTGLRWMKVYLVDYRTGRREQVIESIPFAYWACLQLSPNGRYLVYFKDGHYHAYDTVGRVDRNLTRALDTRFGGQGRQLLQAYPFRKEINPRDVARLAQWRWTDRGNAVVLSDFWDQWLLPLDGKTPSNLTRNGTVSFQRYAVIPEARDSEHEMQWIDPKQPIYFTTLNEQTGANGIAVRDPGGVVRSLYSTDASLRAIKRTRAGRFIFTRETAVDFPDYYAAGADFSSVTRLTDLNPQQRRFQWSPGARLIHYGSANGERRRAVLHLPAGFTEGKRYPTVVSIYEEQSQTLNDYQLPGGTGQGFDLTRLTQNGFAVLLPDIQPQVDEPGPSAVQDVQAGVDAGIKTGIVDPERMGLRGESFGGYETSYIVTQTRLFRAAIAADIMADLLTTSMRNYGTEDGGGPGWSWAGASRINQPYMSGPWWERREAYQKSSPLLFAQNVQTPLLIRQNDRDSSTEFQEGQIFFNALRALNKPVVMLQYVHDGHGAEQTQENAGDFDNRAFDFFAHFLRGAPAPEWWAKGVQ